MVGVSCQLSCFDDSLPGFEVLSSKLRELGLSDSRFNDKSILSCLTGLSTLKYLDLSYNKLTGSGSFYGNLLVIYLALKPFLFSFSYHFFLCVYFLPICSRETSCRFQSLVIKVEKAGEPSSKRESMQR